LMGFAPNVANPIKYTPTCPDTPLKTGKLQLTWYWPATRP